MGPLREARPLSMEIFSEGFQSVSSIQTVKEIDDRLDKLKAFRNASSELLSMYPDLDLMLKTELAHRNLAALQIKDYADNFIKSAHLEIAIPLAECNVDLGDLMVREFTLLKRQFRHWYSKNKIVYFEDTDALEEWNNDVRELFKIAERRETLVRKLAEANESN
jgi:hypothetical protein